MAAFNCQQSQEAANWQQLLARNKIFIFWACHALEHSFQYPFAGLFASPAAVLHASSMDSFPSEFMQLHIWHLHIDESSRGSII